MSNKKFLSIYAYLLIVSAFLGAKVFAINIGVQLSINRMLILLSPIMLLMDGGKVGIDKSSSQAPYTKLLFFWAIYSIILIPLTVKDISAFFHHFFFLFSALITSYFAGKYITSSKAIRLVLISFVVVMLFAAFIGVQEMITGVYRFVDQNNLDYYDLRSALESTIGMRVPISIAGNPNDFGMMMLFASLTSYGLVKIENKKILRVLFVLSALFFAFMVIATQSRSQFISLLLAYGLIFIIAFNRQGKVKQIVFIVLLLLTGSYIISLLHANEDLYLALLEVNLEEQDLVRVNLIKNGFTILFDSLFLGVGVGNIEYHMAQPGLLQTGGVLNIHNWWMEILVSSGIVVFVYYLAVYIKQMFGFWHDTRRFRNTKNEYYYIACYATVSMVVFILSSVAGSSIFNAEWSWAFITMLFMLPELKKSTN